MVVGWKELAIVIREGSPQNDHSSSHVFFTTGRSHYVRWGRMERLADSLIIRMEMCFICLFKRIIHTYANDLVVNAPACRSLLNLL